MTTDEAPAPDLDADAPLHWARRLRWVWPIVGVGVFALALWTLHHELRVYRYRDIAASVRHIPNHQLLLAAGLTALGYLVLTGYDTLALRYIRHPLPYRRIAFASFVAYAVSQTLGFPLVTGGSVRYRLYSGWGLSAVKITNAVAFTSFTFWLGVLSIGGSAFVLEPGVLRGVTGIPPGALRTIGALLVLVVVAYVALSFVRREPVLVRGWSFRVPSPRITLPQVLIATVDWAVAGTVLFSLLPHAPGLTLPRFLGIFVLAQVAGLLSHVPGGLGVFETVIVLLLGPWLRPEQVLGALLAYRAVYYLLPLGVAILLLAAYETLRRAEGVRRAASVFGRWVPGVVPQLLAVSTFVAGAILLFSGATPALGHRLRLIDALLPLPIIELSHFFGSVVGAALLLLSNGLWRRLDGAYHLTVGLLIAGIGFSILKGFDYEEAMVLAVMLGALVPSRRHFYRRASFLSERFTPGWIAAVALVLVGSLWLGFFAYKHVDYSHDLWWHFALMGNAPRFLRASVGAVGVVLIFGVARLLRPAPPEPALPTPEEIARAAAIIDSVPQTTPNLALLGDKELLFNDTGNAFIMYGIEGRSWIALGDPVGPASERAELIWSFRELADRHGAYTVFYEVGRENLHLYLDVGLTLLKIGEEARVPLAGFSLEGKSRKSLRQAHARLERWGLTHRIVPAAEVPNEIEAMRVVSDAWLGEKSAREKSFSLGRFDPDYLARFPAVLVYQEGRLVAFANLWLSGDRDELSVDLMRFLPEANPGTMDYLFVTLMLWGKQEGYRWFNLGVAPLSGLEARKSAPLWARVGSLVFRHGEHFYNFQGLRAYKEKFDPTWEPKYLAVPNGLALPRVLTNVATLISGGLKGIITK